MNADDERRMDAADTLSHSHRVFSAPYESELSKSSGFF